MYNVWQWIKKYWKWIIFPIGLASLAIAFFAGKSQAGPQQSDHSQDAIKDVIDSTEQRDQQLEQLKEEHKERLADLSDDQQQELEELQNKPTEEVVAWFSRL